MRILLLVPNYGPGNYEHIPLGVMYISSYLKLKGYSVDALNLNHYPESKLKETLQAGRYDAVGTGGLFIHMPQMLSIIETVRAFAPKAHIFIGGAIASADPDFILPELKPDSLVLGEGEVTTDLLLKTLESGGDLRCVTGIAFLENGQVVKTLSTPLIEDLDALPFPDYEGFEYGVYLDRYVNPVEQELCAILGNDFVKRPAFPVSSRDCVSRCTFCFRITGGHHRVRSVANFMAEIRHLVEKYKVNILSIADEMFIVDKQRAKEACKELKALGLPWACQARVPSLDDDLLAMLKDSGCYLLSMGFESASPVVLKSMKKGISPAQIERGILGCIKAKLCVQGGFIFGDPAETLETIQETINFSRKFSKIDIIFAPIHPYPGTSLYVDLVKSGQLKDRLAHHMTPSNKPYNMTKLSDLDYEYIYTKAIYESVRRTQALYAKVSVLGKRSDGRQVLDIRCSFCGKLNENCHLDLSSFSSSWRGFIICKHCFQRTFINRCDPRFFDLGTFKYQMRFLWITRWMVISPRFFRFFLPLRRFYAFTKKIAGF